MFSRRAVLSALLGLGVYPTIQNPVLADAEIERSKLLGDFFQPYVNRVADSKMVVAHWHFFRRSIDNAAFPDYYSSQYMTVIGESGKHSSYGGYLRDRPIFRPPIKGTLIEWRTHDHRHEIAIATGMGINCFQINSGAEISDTSVTALMLAAAKETDNFRVMLCVDCDSLAGKSDQEIAGFFNRYGSDERAQRDRRGRLFVTAYRPESIGAQRWKAILRLIALEFVFIPTFLEPAAIDEFWELIDGVVLWRGNDYREFQDGSLTDVVRTHCKRNGKFFAVSISPQDHRARAHQFWESRGSRTAVSGWKYAIERKADAVFLISWNDYAEGHHWQPSVRTQFGYSTLCSYFASWFQSGTPPVISRDLLLYFHRIERADCEDCGRLQAFGRMTNRIGGPDETFDEIELTGFLTEPGQLAINGENRFVPEGVQTFRIPMPRRSMRPSFMLSRNDTKVISLDSNFTIRTSSDFQDLLYHSGTSNALPVTLP